MNIKKTDFIYNGPEYPKNFFEEDEIYWIAGSRYHVLAIADTMFGRLAWATMDRAGRVDVQTLTPSIYLQAQKEVK